ncbi:tyrosine-type recombinase/integrase [Kitasatospora sp. NPDC098663]|uniref:tyrosine-type recombinase/integrase n=1 Tax=Kitasatospora sp. NPDC098663 TaxID=3364096 RepID=UPI003813F32B
MPLRHRHEYAADLPRGLLDGSCLPSWELPAQMLDGIRTAPGPDLPDSSRCLIKGVSHAGSSRTPLHPARRTRTIWQYRPVPALSGLLPPSPASPGSGCPQLHRPAATGSAAKVSHLHSNHSASRRTHDLRHTAANIMIAEGIPVAVVSKTMRHSTLAITIDLYGHLLKDSADEAVEALASALDRADTEVAGLPGSSVDHHFGKAA